MIFRIFYAVRHNQIEEEKLCISSKLGKSDLNMSVITLGTWGMGGDFWGKVDDAQSIATIQAALDARHYHH